ncbi:alpha/beta hydrolase [bacterium SCSIO 12741]|nr:alpha/beta hydrolase [bacterium SCSIO 12741]
MKIYQISGLGAGEEVFKTTRLDFPTQFIPWIIPEPQETIEHYASRMAEAINPDEPFCLMGVSFGGIMSQEIAKLIKPQQIFIVSSAKSRKEIPIYMRAVAELGLTATLPDKLMKQTNGVTHFLFGAKSEGEKQALNEIMENINPDYLRWSLTQIGKWKQKSPPPDLIHIHGNHDFLFPLRNVKNPDHVLPGGHFVAVQRGAEISRIINDYLKN